MNQMIGRENLLARFYPDRPLSTWYCNLLMKCRKTRFLILSEHILCKESIVIMKKSDFEILVHLYVLGPPEFIFIFLQWCLYVCMCVCTHVCVCVCEHDSARTLRSIELKFGTNIISDCRKNLIDFRECRIYSFYTGIQKIIPYHYGLWGQNI